MRLATIGAIAAATLALAGCGDPAPKSDQAQTKDYLNGSDYTEVHVKLKDGRTVLCLAGYRESTCDWEHAK